MPERRKRSSTGQQASRLTNPKPNKTTYCYIAIINATQTMAYVERADHILLTNIL